MNVFTNGQDFPRKLSEVEKYWLYLILPENRPGYKIYRDKIENLYVIGYGKFPPYNLILGKINELPDLSIPSQPLIAKGVFFYDKGSVAVTIFDEFEDQIEIDISSNGFDYWQIQPELLINQEVKWFTYSSWSPGEKHPFDNSELREVEIQRADLELVISPKHKQVWIYDYNLKFNKFIPVTNFYQELLKVARIKDINTMTDINFLFSNIRKFSDDQIRQAFINYNRYWKKFELKPETLIKPGKTNFFKKIFERLLWKK
jgi:hypothetical protein